MTAVKESPKTHVAVFDTARKTQFGWVEQRAAHAKALAHARWIGGIAPKRFAGSAAAAPYETGENSKGGAKEIRRARSAAADPYENLMRANGWCAAWRLRRAARVRGGA